MQLSSPNSAAMQTEVSVNATRPLAVRRELTAIPIRDTSTRLFLLGQLVAHLEASDQSGLAQLVAAGVAPQTLDRLRNLTLADTVRFASGYLGLSINIDCQALEQQLARMDRARDDRERYESFVRRGASPRLLRRLFGVSEIDVRRLRKLIAPATAVGGRPRQPEDHVCLEIQAMWQGMPASLAEKERWWQLALRFDEFPIVSIEAVLDGNALV